MEVGPFICDLEIHTLHRTQQTLGVEQNTVPAEQKHMLPVNLPISVQVVQTF